MPSTRRAVEHPFQCEHDRRQEARFRHPQSLRDYLREFNLAVGAEAPLQLHTAGVEVVTGLTRTDRVAAAITGTEPRARRDWIERGACSDAPEPCSHTQGDQPLHPEGGHERIRDEGASHTGSPRWSADFRSWLDAGGSAYAIYIDDHGEEQWAYPLRSSVARMERSGSGIDRLAAAYLYLLRRCRMNYREAWQVQCGRFADPAIFDAAEAWAAEALRRWYLAFIMRPGVGLA